LNPPGAALPGAADDLGDRGLQPEVVVGDAEPHTSKAPGAQLAQEGRPTCLGLRLGDLDADHLAPTALMDGEGDHQRLGVDVTAVPHLQVLGVEPEVGELALQGSGPEGLDLVVELPADAGDLVLRHVDAQLGDQMVDLPGRDAVDVGLHDHAEERLLRAFARLQEAREVALATALPGHRQLDLADPGRPGSRPVAVPVARARLAHLASTGADLARDLGLHQLGGDHRHRLAQEVGMLGDQGLGDDLGGRHASALGHRGAPSSVDFCGSTDESGVRGGRNFVPAPTQPRSLHHF
jgi:hypothetical protein